MPKTSVVLSHWPKLIENFQTSPLQFYSAVEEAVSRRLIPDTENSRIDWKEGGLLSADREYLRVTRGAHAFDICGAPFGTGFFVSTWLVEERNSLSLLEIAGILIGFLSIPIALTYFFGAAVGIGFSLLVIPVVAILLVQYLNTSREGWDDFLLVIPVFGPLYGLLARPATYYKVDTALMFQEAVQAAVMEVVDGLMEAKGIRVLSGTERKPVMKALAAAR